MIVKLKSYDDIILMLSPYNKSTSYEDEFHTSVFLQTSIDRPLAVYLRSIFS
jgi:hypothetical protein